MIYPDFSVFPSPGRGKVAVFPLTEVASPHCDGQSHDASLRLRGMPFAHGAQVQGADVAQPVRKLRRMEL